MSATVWEAPDGTRWVEVSPGNWFGGSPAAFGPAPSGLTKCEGSAGGTTTDLCPGSGTILPFPGFGPDGCTPVDPGCPGPVFTVRPSTGPIYPGSTGDLMSWDGTAWNLLSKGAGSHDDRINPTPITISFDDSQIGGSPQSVQQSLWTYTNEDCVAHTLTFQYNLPLAWTAISGNHWEPTVTIGPAQSGIDFVTVTAVAARVYTVPNPAGVYEIGTQEVQVEGSTTVSPGETVTWNYVVNINAFTYAAGAANFLLIGQAYTMVHNVRGDA